MAGEESEYNRLADVVLRTDRTTAFVSPRTWPMNAGNVILAANEHVPDLESADDALIGEIFAVARDIAIAMRAAYGCPGTSVRQHNGTAAGQEVDHLHVHVLPRYDGDRLYEQTGEHRFVAPEERADYARRLEASLRDLTLRQTT